MPSKIEPQDWFQARGDETLALDWPGVDENSVVWEIGGYKGRWANQMAMKYNPTVYVFEPQDWAFDEIKVQMGHNAKAHLYQFGLWTHAAKMTLNEYGRDGGTLMQPEAKDPHPVMVTDVYSFFIHEHLENIDVCLMNIEGGEFVLLPYMIGMGMMPHIKYFWCQWHLFVQSSAEKMIRLHKMLAQTHDMYWDCGSTAQAWVRRD